MHDCGTKVLVILFFINKKKEYIKNAGQIF